MAETGKVGVMIPLWAVSNYQKVWLFNNVAFFSVAFFSEKMRGHAPPEIVEIWGKCWKAVLDTLVGRS